MMSLPGSGYRKRIVFLLLALLLVRFWHGQTFELSGTEAYLWLQGHGTNLSPAYWEHGPLTPLLIRIGTLFFGDTELGVRWLAAAIYCGAGFVLFYIARLWFDARAAFWVVVLFAALPLYAVKLSFMSNGTVSVGLMALTLLAFRGAVEEDKLVWWLVGGVTSGLALLVELPNAFWLVGLLLYFAAVPERRARLREMMLWSMVTLAAFFLLPILWWWNSSTVTDLTHSRLANAWPLSHPFNFLPGLKFIGWEIFFLSPLFFLFSIWIFFRLGHKLWQDRHYALLFWVAVPGLIWEAFSAFFQEGHFDLIPALLLPLVLLVGGYGAALVPSRPVFRWVGLAVLIAAGLQSLSQLNPFYLSTTGGSEASSPGPMASWTFNRSASGEEIGTWHRSQHSWKNLADQLNQMQQDQGSSLFITDSPTKASLLSFYLPLHPFVYVETAPGTVTHFDFWNHYWEAASSSDSALYLTRATTPPPDDLQRDFTTVTQLENPPLSEDDRFWKIWFCQKFIGAGHLALPGSTPASTPDMEPLPK